MGEAGIIARHRLPQLLLVKLRGVRQRAFFVGMLQNLTRLLVACALLYGLLWAAGSLFPWGSAEVFGRSLSPAAFSTLTLAALGVPGALWLARRNTPTLLGAARKVDAHYHFANRVATAVECAVGSGDARYTRQTSEGSAGSDSIVGGAGVYATLFQKALLEEVRGLAPRIEPSRVVALKAPGILFAVMLLVVVAEGVAFTPRPGALVALPAADVSRLAGEQPAEEPSDLISRAVRRLQKEAAARNDLQLAAYAQRLEDLRTGDLGRRTGTPTAPAEIDTLLSRLTSDYPSLGHAIALDSSRARIRQGSTALAQSGRRATFSDGRRPTDNPSEAADLGEAAQSPDDPNPNRNDSMPDGERTLENNPDLLPVEAPFAQRTRVDMELTDDGPAPPPKQLPGGLGGDEREPVVIEGYWQADPVNLATQPRYEPPWLKKLKEMQAGPGAGGGGDKAGEGAAGVTNGGEGAGGTWDGAFSGPLQLLGEKGEGEELRLSLGPEGVGSGAVVGRWGVFSPETEDIIGSHTVRELIPGHLSGLTQRYFKR